MTSVPGGWSNPSTRRTGSWPGRPGRVVEDDHPAGRVLAVETDRIGQVVDRGLAPVGHIPVSREPEEARGDQRRERGTVALLRDNGKLLAELVEACIAHRCRRR